MIPSLILGFVPEHALSAVGTLLMTAVLLNLWLSYRRPSKLGPGRPPRVLRVAPSVLCSKGGEKVYQDALRDHGPVVLIPRHGRNEYVIDHEHAFDVLTDAKKFRFDTSVVEMLHLEFVMWFKNGSYVEEMGSTVTDGVQNKLFPTTARITPLLVEAVSDLLPSSDSLILDDVYGLCQKAIGRAMSLLIFGIDDPKSGVADDLAAVTNSVAEMTGIYENTRGWYSAPLLWQYVTLLNSLVSTIIPRFFINLLPKLWATRYEHFASGTKSKRNSFTPLFDSLMARHWTPEQPLLYSIGNFIWCSSVSLGVVFASMHQTAAVASWVIIVLASRREEYLNPLREEWRSIISVDELTGQPRFDGDTLNRLTKLDSFIREVMRTKGDTFAPLRHACEDVQIGPCTVPSGALCVPYVHGVHMRDEAGGKNFNGFQWNNKEPAVRGSKDFISFGLGRWACPGRHLAVNEIKVLTYLLFERYDPFIKDNKGYAVPDPMNTTAVAPEAVLEMRTRSD